MADFKRKYATGTGGDIIIPIIKAGGDDFAVSADWTPAAGDVKISKNGAAAANIATLPVFVTSIGWKFVFSDAELTTARINVNIVDAALKDQHIIIETYGNAAAQHAFDLDADKVTLAAATHTGAVIPTVTTLTGHTAQTGDNFARLGAPAGASVSADVAAVKSDSAEIGTAGAGLTALGGMSAGMKTEVAKSLKEEDVSATSEVSGSVFRDLDRRLWDAIYMQSGSGNTGTTYPNGTPIKPVDDIDDAVSIANTNKLSTIYVSKSALFTANASDKTFIGNGQGKSGKINLDGRIITDCKFVDLEVEGSVSTGSKNQYDNCYMTFAGLNPGVDDRFRRCTIGKQVDAQSENLFIDCRFVAGGLIEVAALDNETINIVGGEGDLEINGLQIASSIVNIYGFKGDMLLTAGNTFGTINLFGCFGKIVDSTGGGATVNIIRDDDQKAVLADTSNMQPKLGAITGSGDNTVLGYFKANLNKAAATPSDIGGTFAPTTDSNEAIRDRGDANWSSSAMNPAVLEETTIAVLTDQKNFTLSAGSTDNDAYNGCVVVIEDASTAVQKAVGVVLDYIGSTKAIVLKDDPTVFTMAATDKIAILADRSLKPSVDNRTVDIDSSGFVERVVLNDTTTTNTDMRGTDGVDTAPMRGTDSAALATVATEARLAELDAANLPTDIANVKSDTAATLTGVNQKKFPNGAVYCDGTTQAGTAYPAGELITPSDDIADALTISNTNNIDKIISSVDVITETLILTDKTLESGAGPGVGSRGTFGSGLKTLLRTTLRGWQMTTAGANGVSELCRFVDCTVFPGTGIEDSTNDLFEKCNFQGTGTINSGYSGKTSGSRFVRSHFEDLTLDMKDYAIGSTTVKDSTGILTIVDSGVVGATKVIEIDNFSGNITNTNTKSFVVKIRGGGGILTIDVANNAGSTVIEGGDWKVIDNSAGGHTVTFQKPNGIDTIQTATDQLAFTAGNVHSHTKVQDDLALTAQQKLDVNTEVDGALDTDIPELAQAAPSATPSVRKSLALLNHIARDKTTTTATEFSIFNDADSKIIKQTIDDTAGTFTRSEAVSGA